MAYNLLDEHWIPVLYRNGNYARLGIRKALEDAHRIRQIAASNPMDNVAVLRFLLAILYWCEGSPSPDVSTGPTDPFPPSWFSKLDSNRDCFMLLGAGPRFYQDKNARRLRGVTDLLQEIPTGNNFWHFKHATDMASELCPTCCAMGLLRLPLFSVTVPKPKLWTGINGVPPVYLVPCGTTLKETLVVNWIPCPNLGSPSWVRPNVNVASGKSVPLLTGLTLLSRRVWLHTSEQYGTCIACGAQGTPMIATCEFDTAGKQEDNSWNDPHVVYSDGEPRKSLKASDLTATGKFRMDRPWPELLARIVETGKLRAGVRSVLIVGFATDQAKNIDVWERTITLPQTAQVSTSSPLSLRQWYRAGAKMPDQIRSRAKVSKASAMGAIRPHVEDIVSKRSGELLAADAEAWDLAAREYDPLMEAVAGSLSPGFTTTARRHRNHIAHVRPNMQAPTEASTRTTRKKKGEGK